MLSAVRSRWVTMLAVAVVAVVVISVSIGLASPDGTVGDGDDTSTAATGRPAPTTSSPTPAASTAPPEPTADLAPEAVRGTYPGRPSATTTEGGVVDWCPAVRTRGAAEAEREFGKAATRAAACTAVAFVLDQRYSRLSLPRRSYDAGDFEDVLSSLAPPTVDAYRPRIDRFVATPSAKGAEDLGLVLFHQRATAGDHVSAGKGRVFYGRAFTTRGYRDRAVWINPTWSTVHIRVDRAKSEPRIVASFEASAAVPVFHTERSRDDMMVVPTRATFFLRHEGGSRWRIGGWDIDGGAPRYEPLDVD